MQNHSRFLSHALLLATLVLSISLPVCAQTVKRNPDGTVEVSDDDTSYTPVQHSSSSSAGSRKSSKRSSHSAARSGGSGRIPAYTKNMGGCTVHRNADGTIEVTDNDASTVHYSGGGTRKASSSSSSRRGGSGSIPAYTKHHGDVSVKRNADGTVEVTDTSSSTKRKH